MPERGVEELAEGYGLERGQPAILFLRASGTRKSQRGLAAASVREDRGRVRLDSSEAAWPPRYPRASNCVDKIGGVAHGSERSDIPRVG
jgi:hypothetical protein